MEPSPQASDKGSSARPNIAEHSRVGDLPRDAIEATLVRLWQETLSITQVGIHDHFFDLGGSSRLAGSLLAGIEKEFGPRYPLALLAEFDTIEKMGTVLRDPGSKLARSLVAIKPGGDRPPLFVVPGAYGDTLYLRHLAYRLPPRQPLYGLQAGGLDGQREYPPRTQDVATLYAGELRSLQPAGPYFIAGHSFGGYVALEMARQLLASGEVVGLLALIDTYAPGARREASWRDRLSMHLGNLRVRSFQAKLGYFGERFRYRLPRLLRSRRLAKWLGLPQGGPKHQLLISTLARYRYSPALYPATVLLIRARQRSWFMKWDPTEKWPSFVADLEIRDVEGEHASIMSEPCVAQIARILDEAVARTQPGGNPAD